MSDRLGHTDGRREAGRQSAQMRLPLEQPKSFPKRRYPPNQKVSLLLSTSQVSYSKDMSDAINEIKRHLSIVDVVQEYIPLKKAGSNWRARCPFHNEKSPSFMVSEDKQIWHCFGCSEGGDVFGFVKKIEGLEFPETLRMLAAKAHVTLDSYRPENSNKKTEALDTIQQAAGFYHDRLLRDADAQVARDYAKKRGLTLETVEDFEVGYAPETWDAVRTHLDEKGFSDQQMLDAGLIIKSERSRGYYDRFRDRLMFPIHDVQGSVIAFGGRMLKDGEGAKYLNSPETTMYHKSQVLFNIHRARQAIRTADAAIVMEGYMDVITAYQAGIHNVVASSGTALTLEQVKLLRRYTKNILFAFDMDEAGQEAARRGAIVAWQLDVNVRVVVSPSAKDPDEGIRKSKEAFVRAIKQAPLFMDYFIDTLAAKVKLGNVEGKKKFTQEVLPLLAALQDVVERSHYVQRLASLVQVESSVIEQALSRVVQITAQRRGSGGDVATSQVPAKPAAATNSQQNVFIRRILALIIQYPEQLAFIIQKLDPENIEDPYFSDLYRNMIIYYTKRNAFDWKGFIQTFPQAVNDDHRVTALLLDENEVISQDINAQTVQLELQTLLNRLERSSILQYIFTLEQQIKIAEDQGNQNQLDQLGREFQHYMGRLNTLS